MMTSGLCVSQASKRVTMRRTTRLLWLGCLREANIRNCIHGPKPHIWPCRPCSSNWPYFGHHPCQTMATTLPNSNVHRPRGPSSRRGGGLGMRRRTTAAWRSAASQTPAID
jgi:hypothetical protein